MISVKTNAHVGPDGTLTVAVPTPLRETDVEVIIVVQPVPARAPSPTAAPTPEELGWPPGFFEETFGAWKGEPLERGPQGEYEERLVCFWKTGKCSVVQALGAQGILLAKEKKPMADNGPEHDVWTDPVSHVEVDPDRASHSSFYNGKTYHFSDKTSKQVFDEDPQLWVSTAHASEISSHLSPTGEPM